MKSRPRIIVAENDAHDAASLATPLRDAGFRVAIATDSRELSRLMDQRPSLAVVDSTFTLGRPSANAQLRRMRRDPGLRRLPVVVVCREEDPDDRLAAFRGGADAYLVKPICTRELVLRVRAILRRTLAA